MKLIHAKQAALVSDEDASHALRRYKQIENSRPSGSQIARYGALGAGVGVGATALKDYIAKGSRDVLGGPGKRLRGAAAAGIVGAVTSGGLPLLRSHLDQQAEKATLKTYLNQRSSMRSQPAPVAAPVKMARLLSEQELLDTYDKLGEGSSEPSEKLKRERALTLASAGGVAGADALFRILNQNVQGKPIHDAGVWDKLRQRVSDLGAHHAEIPFFQGGYSPANSLVITNKLAPDVSILAHELGHHNVQQGPLLKHTQSTPARHAFRASGLVGLASGALSGMSDNTAVRAAGIAAPALTALPTLISEAGASIHGMRHLRAAGASPEMLRASRNRLLSAFGTYGAGALAGVAAAGATQGLVQWGREHSAQQRKQAAGAPTRGGFLMASEVPAFRSPSLRSPLQLQPANIVTKMGAATTPAGRLASTRRVGLPKSSPAPGASIADSVPTFGQRMPGANKTTIGKIQPPAV